MYDGILKIAFLHRAKDPYTYERIKYFVNKNHNVYSVIFDLDETTPSHNDFVQYKLRKTVLDKIPLAKRFIHYFELKKILKKIDPDVLHVVNALNLAYLSYKFNFLKVIENQGSDVIHTPLKFKMLIPFYKYMYKKTDAVIQDSKIAQDYGIKYGAPKENDRNKVIEIGIDFNTFNNEVPKGIIRKKLGFGDRQVIFHSRGVEDPIYNIDIAIKSILVVKKNYPECILILTARKEQLNLQLQDFIHKNSLEKNIYFAGYQDRVKDLKYFYRDADVNISIPSSDSSPFSVYESMACLTPNIVTDLPWVYSNFIPGKHLMVCSVRSAESLADKINTILNCQHNLDLLSAYNIVYEKINLLKENEKLEMFYRSTLENKINRAKK
jgi:glycosyltransferase involved in cell wall biosynthesis